MTHSARYCTAKTPIGLYPTTSAQKSNQHHEPQKQLRKPPRHSGPLVGSSAIYS